MNFNQSNNVTPIYEECVTLVKQKKYLEAKKIIKQMIQNTNSDNIHILNLTACIYSYLNKHSKALEFLDYNYNFVHYDSDKSYYGRRWSFPKLYRYLNNGGVFISDDIQDNLYFADFVTKLNLEFYVIKFENKFVGIFFKK